MDSVVHPNAWAALKLPNGSLRVLEVTPNTTISLGKYGSFPSNFIIERPYHLTYELQDKQADESFNRLRIVPASELYSDVLSSTSASSSPVAAGVTAEEEDGDAALPTAVEYSLVDPQSGEVVAKTNPAELNASARQTLSMAEIEELKRDGTDSGKGLIAKLMLSHTALDQKTEYSLAKYKLLKTKKYIRQFTVLPLDVALLAHWFWSEKEPAKTLDMREEIIGLLGCWANVHFAGVDQPETEGQGSLALDGTPPPTPEHKPGRWLVVDDACGLLVAAMAERMGILYPAATNDSKQDAYSEAQPPPKTPKVSPDGPQPTPADEVDLEAESQLPEASQPPATDGEEQAEAEAQQQRETQPAPRAAKHAVANHHRNDLRIPYASSNTITVIHSNSQPNLALLRYFNFDAADPTQPWTHPLARHLMTLSWLQLLEPTKDSTYSSEVKMSDAEELASWKSTRRGQYHRKRRRWARCRYVVDTTRAGGFAGLVVASTMDPISILRHTVPLLAGGAPIAIYSQSPEALTALVDCYSIARRASWVSNPPQELDGKSATELENWSGNEDFPVNPTLLLGASIQTSRVRKWQVLPGRTHPLMTSRGGAEGYVFTAWRVKPAEGKVEARGKGRTRKRKAEET